MEYHTTRNAIGEEVEVLTEFKKLMRYLGLEHVPQYHRYQSMAILKSFCKGEQFYSEDNKSDYIYFLLSGVLRGYTIEQDGKDITDCFLFRYGQAHIGFLNTGENGFLTERAEAITDASVMCFEVKALSAEIYNSLELSRLYSAKLMESYVEHWVHKNVRFRYSASDRYLWFLKAYPGLIDIVPHKHIASFLGMTPETLSRLRRNLREEI